MIEPIPFEATDWASLDTPCFVFDEPELRENYCDFDRAVKAAWSPLARVAYSIKTNPLPWVLGVARTAGCMAEAVSGEELAVALECGFECTRSFNRAFQRILGMSPSQFRKQSR